MADILSPPELIVVFQNPTNLPSPHPAPKRAYDKVFFSNNTKPLPQTMLTKSSQAK